MSTKVNGLGHIGFYAKDLDFMKDFYANFMGLTLTKVGPFGAFSALIRRPSITRLR